MKYTIAPEINKFNSAPRPKSNTGHSIFLTLFADGDIILVWIFVCHATWKVVLVCFLLITSTTFQLPDAILKNPVSIIYVVNIYIQLSSVLELLS